MDRLLSIEIFIEVVNVGSFTAAADKFGITPAMVGKHIKNLELQAGATLLNRSTRKQSLTEIGEDYLLSYQNIMNEFAILEQKTAQIAQSPSGTLRINAPLTFGSHLLSPLLCDYLDLNPHMQVNLELSDKMVDVIHDGYDAVFRIGTLNDASYIARKICDYEMVFCASPSYLNKHGMPTSLTDLKQHQCLSFNYWGNQSKLTAEIESNEFDINKSRFRSNNGSALKSAALKGWGILLQPKILVQKELNTGELVAILPHFTPKPQPVHLLYPSRSNQTVKLKSFIKYITDKKIKTTMMGK